MGKTIKGQNVRIKIGGKVVAGATSCTCHTAAQLEETSTKDSTGSWTEQEVVALSWDGSVDGLVMNDASDTAAIQGMNAHDLIGQTVDVSFIETEGEKNREQKASGVEREGKAIVSDVTQTFANKQNGTFTIQLTGVGELKKK